MNLAKLSIVLLATATTLSVLHASAATMQTRMAMDNATANVDFLDRSSRLALDHSEDARLRSYARNVALEQTLAANSLYDFAQGARPQVASNGGAGGETLLTGRSAAVEGQVALTDNRLPLGQEDLDGLEGLSGKDFVDQYKTKQLEALRQLDTDYSDYIAKGDDPVLLGIANRELPIVRRELGALRKL